TYGEIQRRIEQQMVARLADMLLQPSVTQGVKAQIWHMLQLRRDQLQADSEGSAPWQVHDQFVLARITRLLDSPDVLPESPAPEAPPGSPIGAKR
ncbi:MAG: hypothetical protein AAF438_17520, partial [Pseudomonadota bacterium]